MKKKLKIYRREINEANINLPPDLPPLLYRIYVSRGVRSAADIERSVKGMLPWYQLSNIEKAANMLYEALCTNKRIVIIGDFDTDGATSIALSVLCLYTLGYKNITYIIPNRFKDGYGLSPNIVDQAYYIYGAQMIMTVDNGISSYDGIDRAGQLGIPVLITDHHLPDKELPNAEVIVNPNLRNCSFPSKSLAGVGVVFYVMLALRKLLYSKNWFISKNIIMPNLAKYLDLVALGTVADVVPLDTNNRILIWQGLNRIRAEKCRPGIKALIEITNCNIRTLTASDLGFTISPRLNAAGRLNDMSISVALLLCNNLIEARMLAKELNILNQTRKKIEQIMYNKALNICEELKNKKNKLPNGIVIHHPKWHQGIIGILASRIKDYFNRPVIAFASIGKGILKGSGRSIQGMHMHDTLDYLNNIYPELIIKFGGHAMAVGLLLKETKLNEFQFYFNEIATKRLNSSLLQNIIISDGPLSPKEMTIEVGQMLRDAGPWGQMFPEPLFDGRFHLLQQFIINKRHLKVLIKPNNTGGPLLNGIVFNINTTIWPNNNVKEVELAYRLSIEEFQGKRSLQIIICNIWPL